MKSLYFIHDGGDDDDDDDDDDEDDVDVDDLLVTMKIASALSLPLLVMTEKRSQGTRFIWRDAFKFFLRGLSQASLQKHAMFEGQVFGRKLRKVVVLKKPVYFSIGGFHAFCNSHADHCSSWVLFRK